MIIGIPKEIKNNENRVALTPAGAATLTSAGLEVYVETLAGEGSGFSDKEYQEHGAIVLSSADEVWEKAEMIMKVKEPLESEYKYFRQDLIIFTYLHLAAVPALAEAMTEKGVTSIAYETIVVDGKLPLLTPMSEVAGRMSIQIGAHYLEKHAGGSGVLLSGIPGVDRGVVTVIGGGVVGESAARIAVGMGAKVNILDLNPTRLRELEHIFGNDVQILMSNPTNIEKSVLESDLVIGSVLIPGRKAPKLVTEDTIKRMKKGSVLVDVSIDQGGNFETISEATTHAEPIVEKHGILHYAVANIPGAVPRTATIGLTNDTVPYALQIAKNGLEEAIKRNPLIEPGLNTYKGYVTVEGIADDLGMEYKSFSDLNQ